MVLCPKCNNKLHNPKFIPFFINNKFLIKDTYSIEVELSNEELNMIIDELNAIINSIDLWDLKH